jgi:hypothetical protein
MPNVNGKKYAYTPKGIAAAKKAAKSNPDTVPPGVDPETGLRNSTKTKKMSSAAIRGKDNAMKERARMSALASMREKAKKKTFKIPASPTN